MENGVLGSPGVDATPGSPAAPPGDAPVDGRTARARRTRDAIVAACVVLVNRGDARPTAPRIAEEAGVSVRSVFQHFADLETLFALVAERSVQDVADLIRPVDPGLPFDERLDRFVRQRADLLEALTPIRRAAAVHSPFSPAIRERLEAGHQFLRSELAQVFAMELEAVDPDRREQVLDLLDVGTTWSTWDVLRTLVGRERDQAVATLAAAIRAALAPVPPIPPDRP